MKSRIRTIVRIAGLALVAASACVSQARAGSASAAFNVSVQLTPADRPSGGPSSPPVFARVLAPLNGGFETACVLAGVCVGSGTITGWRIVSQAGREYLEITLGW